jgi:hypothetical protein
VSLGDEDALVLAAIDFPPLKRREQRLYLNLEFLKRIVLCNPTRLLFVVFDVGLVEEQLWHD